MVNFGLCCGFVLVVSLFVLIVVGGLFFLGVCVVVDFLEM